ncbi:MAG: hypothetical protein WCD79_22725 [Chthoniobacteraceae bacterium]
MAFHTQNVFCQTNNLNQAVHEKVERYSVADPEGKDWENTKKAFAGHPQEELASALIADLDVDRGGQSKNRTRDLAVTKLYQALNLPPTFVCKELEKDQSPQRKAALMTILYRQNTADVTAALLHQLKDRRPAVEFDAYNYEMPVYSMRVCDVACNILSNTLEPNRSGYRIGPSCPYERRDEIIKETLKELKLDSSK